MDCSKRNEKKYLVRNSPAYSASDCPDIQMKGNDGIMYVSQKRGASKSYRWYKMVENLKISRKSRTGRSKSRTGSKYRTGRSKYRTGRSKSRIGRSKYRKSRIGRRSIKKGVKICNPQHKNALNDLYMCNPGSGRWVLKSGPTGQKLLAQNQGQVMIGPLQKKKTRKSLKKRKVKKNAGKPGYILNPKTGIWVLKSGKIGRLAGYHINQVNNSKCMVDKPISQYSAHDLKTRCVVGCKLPFATRINDTRMLYNLILWHSGKCANEISLMGDPVEEIDKKKLIRLNDSCYDVDNLVQTLIANGDKNQDVYSPEKKLWATLRDKDLITEHPGLDKNIKKTYSDMIKKQELENRELIISDPKAPNIIKTIVEVGWIAANDNLTSHEHDPEKFEISQLALTNLMNTINNLQNKEQWESVSFEGLRLGSILNSLENTCIHGIGSSLIKLGYYMFLKSFELGVMVTLPDIVTILDNGISYIQFVDDENYTKETGIAGIVTTFGVNPSRMNISKVSKKDIQNKENIYKKWNKIKREEKGIIKIRTTVPKRALSSRILYYITTNDVKGLTETLKENPKYKKLNGDAFLTSILNSTRYNSQTLSLVDKIIKSFKMSKKSAFVNGIVEKIVQEFLLHGKTNISLERSLIMLLEDDFSVDATTFEIAKNKPKLVEKLLEYVPMTTKVLGYLKKMKDISKACSNPEDNILFEPWDNEADLIMLYNMGFYCLNRESLKQFWKSNDQNYSQDIEYSLKHDGEPNPSKKVYPVYTPKIVYIDENGVSLLMSQKHITYSLIHPKEFMLIKKGSLPVSSDIYNVVPRDSVNDYR